MSTLLNQLNAIAVNAARLAAETAARQAHAADMLHRRSEARRKAWTGRRDPYAGKGLKAALLDRLPVGEDNAIGLPEIKKLLPDIDYADNGLSATLTNLSDAGAVGRTGQKYRYRYYRKESPCLK